MTDLDPLPITPDFDVWPVTQQPTKVLAEDTALVIVWSDDQVGRDHLYVSAENDPAPGTLHPVSRQTTLSPLDLPADLEVRDAAPTLGGAVQICWAPERKPSHFHPGWLRGIGWFGEGAPAAAPLLWNAKDQPVPPTFDGPKALSNLEFFL